MDSEKVVESFVLSRELRRKLRDLLAKRALVIKTVRLKSGIVSPYYFDCKQVTLSAEGATMIADAFLEAIDWLPEAPVAVGGMTMGADPIVGAVMMRALERGSTIDSFYVRKEPKKHGTQAWIENPPPPGSKVVIVEDVVTTGGSTMDALARVRDAGCQVLGVICMIDREKGGGDTIRAVCPRYIHLYTLRDFPEIQDLPLPSSTDG